MFIILSNFSKLQYSKEQHAMNRLSEMRVDSTLPPASHSRQVSNDYIAAAAGVDKTGHVSMTSRLAKYDSVGMTLVAAKEDRRKTLTFSPSSLYLPPLYFLISLHICNIYYIIITYLPLFFSPSRALLCPTIFLSSSISPPISLPASFVCKPDKWPWRCLQHNRNVFCPLNPRESFLIPTTLRHALRRPVWCRHRGSGATTRTIQTQWVVSYLPTNTVLLFFVSLCLSCCQQYT